MAFPQELIDIIIDNLHEDIPSLKACSLSARTFVASARIHIFRKIEILPPTVSSPNACQGLYKLLTSSPHIPPLVKELSVVLVGSETSFAYDEDGKYLQERHVTWIMAGRTLPLILPLLDLKRISLTENAPPHWNDGGKFSMNWTKMGRQLKSALANVFSSPRLEAVHLRGIVVESARELLSLFSEATSLKELSLSRVYFTQHWDESWPESQPWRPQLRSLLVSDGDGDGDELSRYLVNPRIDLATVRSLTLAADSMEWRDKIFQATKSGSGGVEHLRLWGGKSLGSNLGQELANLRSIHLFSSSIFWLLGEFFTICPHESRLEYIALEGYARVPTQGLSVLNTNVDFTVAQLRFLRMVEIKATKTVIFDSFAEWEAAVRAALPSLEGRGILRVTDTEWPEDDAHYGWE
ncbi:hypothetical protein B0H19DRAFT_681588 [Mycena capillaripes]|nr:hypothetical protein B0H19DRAFT_681588 [Mycena capillaripes]